MQDMTPPLVIVVALSRTDRAIGHGDGLLWHIPEDLKRFKALTLGHPIILGRRTFESILTILGKPLPGRTNIVVTRDTTYVYPGVTVTHSLEEALEAARKEHPTEIHIGGGAEMYRQALPYVSRIHATWIFDSKEADTFFPPFEEDFIILTEHPRASSQGVEYQWVDYVRKSS